MRKDVTVAAETRDSRGKNEARRLRISGSAPAILYGSGGAAIAISVDPKEVTRILHSKGGHNTIFNVEVKGVENSPVMIVDWQEEPIQGKLLHVDLKRIDLSKKLRVKVPVDTTGEPKGVKQQGGLLEVVVREVEVECLPDDIPESFVVDVTELMIGENKRASDLVMPDAVRLVSAPDAVLAHVVLLRIVEEAKPAEEVAAPAAPEPEVIKKGKKEEEGAAEGEEKKK
jgi:large subunit ribosomal protein L25